MTSFEADVKPLFRESDRLEMDFLFDLWSYDDVRQEAENILHRLVDQTMPCDRPWPAEKIDIFRTWMADDFPQ